MWLSFRLYLQSEKQRVIQLGCGRISKQSHRLYLACLYGVSFSSLYDVIKFQKKLKEKIH